MRFNKHNGRKYAVLVMAFLLVYSFILGGLIYNYPPREGILSSFYPQEGEQSKMRPHPVVMTTADLTGDGVDDILVGWDDGTLTHYDVSENITRNITCHGEITGIFINGHTVYVIDRLGHVDVLRFEYGEIRRINEFSFMPGITGTALINRTDDGVIFAYTIPEISEIGVAEVSSNNIIGVVSVNTPYAGYSVDVLNMPDGIYIACVNLAGIDGILLYRFYGNNLLDMYHLNTHTEVTSTLCGHFISPTVMTLATLNYRNNSVSFYSIVDGNFIPDFSMPTLMSPYRAMARDMNNDGLLDLMVLNFKSHSISILYPAYNSSLSIATGRSPVDLAIWHSPQGDALCILNRYSSDVSFIRLEPELSGPIMIGSAIRIGDLHTLKLNDSPCVLYASQSPPRVVLKILTPPYMETSVYRGEGRIGLTLLSKRNDSVVLAVSDYKNENITLATITLHNNVISVYTENISTMRNITSMAAGDMDGDGRIDLVFVAYSTPRSVLGILYSSESGWKKCTFTSVADYPVGLNIDDVNYDGYEDVIVVGRTGVHYIYYGDGKGGITDDSPVELSMRGYA